MPLVIFEPTSPTKSGGKLSLSKARWLWMSVVMEATTTLVVALPKVGESRLMTMMLGRIRRGNSSFLGQALPVAKPGLTYKKEAGSGADHRCGDQFAHGAEPLNLSHYNAFTPL